MNRLALVVISGVVTLVPSFVLAQEDISATSTSPPAMIPESVLETPEISIPAPVMEKEGKKREKKLKGEHKHKDKKYKGEHKGKHKGEGKGKGKHKGKYKNK